MNKLLIKAFIIISAFLICLLPINALENENKFKDTDYKLISVNSSNDSNFNTYVFKNINKSYTFNENS